MTSIEWSERADVEYIVAHMREADAEEIYAIEGFDPERLVDAAMASGITLVVKKDDKPVICMGAQEVASGTWQVFMFATDEFLSCSLFTTRYVIRKIIPTAISQGAKRGFCWSMKGHDVAHRWLKMLGAREVGEEALGRAGQTFTEFEWIFPNVRTQGPT